MLEEYFMQQKDGVDAITRPVSGDLTSDATISDPDSEDSYDNEVFVSKRVTRHWVRGRNGLRTNARKQNNHLSRFGQVNGYNRSHQLSTARRSSWSNMQQRSRRLVKAAKVARARKSSAQATQEGVADGGLIKRVDHLMANFRQNFITFAMHLKSQEFSASLNSKIEAEQKLQEKLREEHRVLENEVTGLKKKMLSQLETQLDELGLLHTPESLVRAVREALKQNQFLKKEATGLKQEVEQLGRDIAGSGTDICITCEQGSKNGFVADLHTKIRQQIITAFQEREGLKQQVDELKREMAMLSEIGNTVRPSTDVVQSHSVQMPDKSKQPTAVTKIDGIPTTVIKQPVSAKKKQGQPLLTDTDSSKQLASVNKKQGQPLLSKSESKRQAVPAKTKQGQPELTEPESSKQPVHVKEKQDQAQLPDSEMKKTKKSPKPKFVSKTFVSVAEVEPKLAPSSLTQQVTAATAKSKDDAVDSMESNQLEEKSEKNHVKAVKAPMSIVEDPKDDLPGDKALDGSSVNNQLDKSSPQDKARANKVSTSRLASKHGKGPGRQLNSFMRYSSRIAVRQLESACPEDAMAVQETLESMETDTPMKEIRKCSREVKNLGNMFPLPSRPRNRIQSTSEIRQEVGGKRTKIKRSVRKKEKTESRKILESNKETQPVIATAEEQDNRIEQRRKQKHLQHPVLEQREDNDNHESIVGTIQATAYGELCLDSKSGDSPKLKMLKQMNYCVPLDDRNRSMEISTNVKEPEQLNVCGPSDSSTPFIPMSVSAPVSTVPCITSGTTSTIACASPAVVTSSVREVIPVPSLITERDDALKFSERKFQGKKYSQHGKNRQLHEPLHSRRRCFKSRWENGGERWVTVGNCSSSSSRRSVDPRRPRPMQQLDCATSGVHMDTGIELQHLQLLLNMENTSAMQSNHPTLFRETTESRKETQLMEIIDISSQLVPMNTSTESASPTSYPNLSMNQEFVSPQTPVSCSYELSNQSPSVVVDRPCLGQRPLSVDLSCRENLDSYSVADQNTYGFDTNCHTKSPTMADNRWSDPESSGSIKIGQGVIALPVGSSVGDSPVHQLSQGNQKEPKPKKKILTLGTYLKNRQAASAHNNKHDGKTENASRQLQHASAISPLSSLPPLPPGTTVNSSGRLRPPPPPPPPLPLSLKSQSTSSSGLRLGDKDYPKFKSLHLDGKEQAKHRCELFQSKPNASSTHKGGSPTDMIFGIPLPSSVAKMVNSVLPLRGQLSGGCMTNSRTEEKCVDDSPNKTQKTKTTDGVKTSSPVKEQNAIGCLEGSFSAQQKTSSLETVSFIYEKLTNSSSIESLSPTSEQQTTRAEEINDDIQKTSDSLDSSLPCAVGTGMKQKPAIGGDTVLGEKSNQNTVKSCLKTLVTAGNSTDTENGDGMFAVRQEDVVDCSTGVPSVCKPNTKGTLAEEMGLAEPLQVTKDLEGAHATNEPQDTCTLTKSPVRELEITDSVRAMFQVSEQRKTHTTLEAEPSLSELKRRDVIEEIPAVTPSPVSQQKTANSLHDIRLGSQQITKEEIEKANSALDDKATNTSQPEPNPIFAVCEPTPTDHLESVPALNEEKHLASLQTVPLSAEETSPAVESVFVVVNQDTEDSVELMPTFSKQEQSGLGPTSVDNRQMMCDGLPAMSSRKDSVAYEHPEALNDEDMGREDNVDGVLLFDNANSPASNHIYITDSDDDSRYPSVCSPSMEKAKMEDKAQKMLQTPPYRRLVDSDYGSTPESEKEAQEEKDEGYVNTELWSLAEVACQQHKEQVYISDRAEESDCDHVIQDSSKTHIEAGSSQSQMTLGKLLDGQSSDTSGSISKLLDNQEFETVSCESVCPHHPEDCHLESLPSNQETRSRDLDSTDNGAVNSVSHVSWSSGAGSGSETTCTVSAGASSTSSKRNHVDECPEDTPSKKQQYTQAGALTKLRNEEEHVEAAEPSVRSTRNQWRQLSSERVDERNKETTHGGEKLTMHKFSVQSRRKKPKWIHGGFESSDSDQDKASVNQGWPRWRASSEYAQVKRRLFDNCQLNDRKRKSTSRGRDSKESYRRKSSDSDRSSSRSCDEYAEHHGGRLQRQEVIRQKEHSDGWLDKPDGYGSILQDDHKSASKRHKSKPDDMERIQERCPTGFRVKSTDRQDADGADRELRSRHARSSRSGEQKGKSRRDLRSSDGSTAGKR
jgi:hypothetical protein